eukprot:TRINITY_DN4241_c0_g3_i1.p1 TRINITY_DN4241_c0_g3~~TRINITY_DN4241_c0_g3_i1.p1  ORF type:complete len:571 (+),score=203.23 TRINITY_DN4241_c0_g3_i1:61-1773(+)
MPAGKGDVESAGQRESVGLLSHAASVMSHARHSDPWARGSFAPTSLLGQRDHTEGLTRIGCFMGGVLDDYRRRLRSYPDDLKSGLDLKTLSSALFMFFATFFSTVALGVMVEDKTDGAIGTEEYLLMNSLAGMLHALLGCQPLLVLRPTGPITLIITTLYSIADSFGVAFHPLLALTGVFVGFYMILVAGFELSRWILYLTRYTHEIFAFFVCSIYIHDGIVGVTNGFSTAAPVFGKSMLLAVMALVTFFVSMLLNYAPVKWTVFTPRVREFLSDYAATIAVFVTVGVSYAFGQDVADHSVDRVQMPAEQWTPTNASRDWYIGVSSDPNVWWLSALCAVPIVFFFFMDQNVSSLYTQLPEMQLVKGSYYHSSFLCMGVFNIVGPLFGLPFVTGSLPHSPQFVKALSHYDADGRTVSHVIETRLAPFLMYFLIGLPLLTPSALETLPKACSSGILLFVGVAGLTDTQLYERLKCLLKHPDNFPQAFQAVPWTVLHAFTAVQVLILGVAWAVNLSPAALLFSVIVVMIVPFRRFVIPTMFSEYLDVLDAEHDGSPGAPQGGHHDYTALDKEG